MSTPHDTFFRNLFHHPDVAAEHFSGMVPVALRDHIQWPSLRYEKTVTVNASGKQIRSDLVFSAQVSGHGRALLYLHFEHQRRAEILMAVRMIEYLTRIWQAWARQHEWAAVAALQHGLERIQAVLSYLGDTVGEPPKPTLRRLVAQLPGSTKETIMTWAETLEARGREAGREAGLLEGRRQLLTRQLGVRFGELPTWASEHIAKADVDTLDRWAEALLTTASLEALFEPGSGEP